MRQLSELRQDLVTGEWVVVATARARRPNDFAKRIHSIRRQPKTDCPFEKFSSHALLAYDAKGERFPTHSSGVRLDRKDRTYLNRAWQVQVIPNKYPAFAQHGVCAVERTIGPHHWQDGVGFHEIVITRDHTKSIAEMSEKEVAVILHAYRERYLALKDDSCVEYISIFHNHGPSAGASISHPHSQIIAIPVIPPDVGRSLRGSAEYFKKNRTCVHCTMLAFERKEKTRILYENDRFTVLCPYVSRSAFEIHLFPRDHASEFEETSDRDLNAAADVIRRAIRAIGRSLNNPDYNFFIHTAPTAGGGAAHSYHWHIEIIPKTAIWAGFEIGTGIEISTISPESAAKYLRTFIR